MGLSSLGSLTCMQMWELKRTLGKVSNEKPTHNWKLQNHLLGMLQLWDVWNVGKGKRHSWNWLDQHKQEPEQADTLGMPCSSPAFSFSVYLMMQLGCCHTKWREYAVRSRKTVCKDSKRRRSKAISARSIWEDEEHGNGGTLTAILVFLQPNGVYHTMHWLRNRYKLPLPMCL